MAIYDVDAIREHDEDIGAADSDSVLDNMLEACDQMLTALDESKARRRYFEALNKQADKHEDNSRTYESISRDLKNLNHGQAASEYYHKAAKEGRKSGDLRWKAKRYDPEYLRNHYVGDDDEFDVEEKSPIDAGKAAEDNFKKDLDAYPAKERKPGMYKTIQDKKRSIKETCLTILSVLDEI